MNNSYNASIRAEHESLEGYLRTVLEPRKLERVAIISFSQWEMNTAAVGEIAATLHAMGTSPVLALWADETPLKDVGWSTSRRLARLFMSRARDEWVERGLLGLGLSKDSVTCPPIDPWRPAAEIPTAKHLYRSAIRQLTYRGAPVGRAILQVHPDSNTPITDDHDWPRLWVEQSLLSFAWAFDQSYELLTKSEATALVVFNGRFLHDSAAASAAEKLGIPVLSFDFGGNDTDFDLTIDHTHDWSALQQRMLTMYNSWDAKERDEIGARWFEERLQHTDPRNLLFTESQTVGTGIEKPEGQRLVVFFSSSGDEISELDLDWSEYFFSQEGALNAVANVCRELGNTLLLVRTHPHKRHKPQRDVEEWHAAVAAASPDIHLDEFSEVDSYTLMRQADVVVTYGSTTGVEAAYAQRPVVVMGPSAYDELGCAIRVTNERELRDALARPRPGNQAGALSYGLMMRRRGFANRYVMRHDGNQVLGGVKIRDAHPIVLKLSDRQAVKQKESLRRTSTT